MKLLVGTLLDASSMTATTTIDTKMDRRRAANVPRKKFNTFSSRVMLLIATCLMVMTRVCSAEMLWDHIVNLDENYQLLWKVREPDIVFEVQVRTRGYVGFGFSRDGTIYGADIFIGWIDNGHTFFHVS